MNTNDSVLIDGLILFTRKELMKILKISLSSIDQIPELELPRVRFGKSVRFTKDSINNYIKEHQIKKELL